MGWNDHYCLYGDVEIPEKYVCASDFENKEIKCFIQENTLSGIYEQYSCSYCKRTNGVIKLSTLIEFIYSRINEEYDHPDNAGVGYDSSSWDDEDNEFFTRDYGYILPNYRKIYETEGLPPLSDLRGLSDSLFQDIIECAPHDIWCFTDPYGLKYNEEMDIKWKSFSELVKYKCRYTFFKSSLFNIEASDNGLEDILTEIQNLVLNNNLVSDLMPTVDIFRCRYHDSVESYSLLKDLASPPIAKYPNRMSPIGISMFYGAFDKDTAKKEAISEEKDAVTTAIFRLKQSIKVIDFTDLPRVPNFWDASSNIIEAILFLRKFAYEISKPVKKDEDSNVEYIPTQILTEYFRYTFTQQKIDGLIYNSNANNGKQCCVLFYNNQDCHLEMDLITTEKELC